MSREGGAQIPSVKGNYDDLHSFIPVQAPCSLFMPRPPRQCENYPTTCSAKPRKPILSLLSLLQPSLLPDTQPTPSVQPSPILSLFEPQKPQ